MSVTGDILRSNIHDLYFGHYSYGHQGGVWSYNEVGARLVPYPLLPYLASYLDVGVTSGMTLVGKVLNRPFAHCCCVHCASCRSFVQVHHNIAYGFDPHDDSDDLIIHNNHVHNNGWHGISE